MRLPPWQLAALQQDTLSKLPRHGHVVSCVGISVPLLQHGLCLELWKLHAAPCLSVAALAPTYQGDC